MKLGQIFMGLYATRIYIPFSNFARGWKEFRNKRKGKEGKFVQSRTLPTAKWSSCVKPRWIRLVETAKANGNVRISELAVLAQCARNISDDGNIFEIGTFDGRTTLNLALNQCGKGKVFTLDLPPEAPTKFDVEKGERHFIDKPASGARYVAREEEMPEVVGRITQLFGDSADFDFSEYEGTCSLVFVDGSHAYDYAVADTKTAMKLIRPGGVIIWHDYGIWKGVTEALDEMEENEKLGFRSVQGTSLVFWQKPN
ncbi:MAG: class I SAM-dependent methyltransferase [Limisphaerales bacterium]